MKKQLFMLALSVLGLSAFCQSTIWQPYNSNIDTSTYVRYISAVDTNTVWGIGFPGGANPAPNHFTRTIDGANFHSGTFLPDTNTYAPSSICAVDANTAFIPVYVKTASASMNGKLLKTTNGGATWTNIAATGTTNTTGMFLGINNFPDWVYFWDANNGITLGDPNGSTTTGNGNRFEIWRTHNGGTNWTRVVDANVPVPLTNEYGLTNSFTTWKGHVWFGTGGTGSVVGRVYASADSGKTWTVSTPTGLLGGAQGLAFRDSLNGMVWGSTSAASYIFQLMKTSDGGNTWTRLNLGTNVGINSICAIPKTKGYMSVGLDSASDQGTGVVGNGIITSVTYNDGASWTILESHAGAAAGTYTVLPFYMESVQMLDSLNGWAGNLSNVTLPYGTDGMNKFRLGHNPGCPITISTTSSSSPFNVCHDSSAVLTASGLNTYTWSTSATTASITVTPSVTTSYSVAGTTTAGCANYETFNITVISPTVTAASKIICAQYSTSLTAVGATTYTWSPAASLNMNTGTTVIASPTVTTTYTITGTELGCNATATATVTVKPTPNLMATSSTGTASICSGTTATLTASGANSYTWSPVGGNTSTITVTPGTTTSYTIAGTGTVNTCVGKSQVTVNVIPSPSMLITASSHTLCPGGTATLTANGANTYTWSPAGTLSSATGNTVTATPPVGVISYSIAGTSTNTCIGNSTITLTVVTSCVAGIEQISSNTNISVYPNPSNGLITVSISNVDAGTVVYVTDLIGQEVIKTSIKDVNTNLDLSALQKGIYMLTITNGQYRHIEKVIIQ